MELSIVWVGQRLCSNNGEVLRTAAVRGLGITLLPKFIIEPELQQRALQLVLPDYHPPELIISVIYPVNRQRSTKICLLVEFRKEQLNRW